MATISSSHLNKPFKILNNVSLYFSGEVAIIVMDRGENRINPEFLSTMMELLDDVEKNENIKGLITTGKGKFYGNGLDLAKLATLTTEASMDFGINFAHFMKRLVLFPIPTLAALNGHCFAGGALIAFCHDLRTMQNNKGWVCFNEVFIDKVFAKCHYPLLRAKMGNGRNLTDALVLGKRHTAPECLDRGLVHASPSPGILLAESVRLLKSLYGKNGYNRDSLKSMKEDVYQQYLEVYEQEFGENVPAKPVLDSIAVPKSNL